MFIAAWLPKPWVLTSARQAGICWRFRKGPEYPLHSPSPIFSGEDNSTGHRSPFLLVKCFFFFQFRRNKPESIMGVSLASMCRNTKSNCWNEKT